jgi:cytochrome c oxidase assembly factor CtaG
LIHDLEHLTFFAVSMLFWWHVTAAAPRIHKRLPPFARFVYVLAAIPPNMLAGVAIAFARGPIYPYYEAMPRLWGLSVMEDQQIAGVIMWVPGSMMYMIAALVLVGRYLQEEEKKPPIPLSVRTADAKQAAPVLKK